MHVRDLKGKRICILGFGREGQSTLRALEKYAPGCSITIADKNQELGIKNYEYHCGEHYLDNLDRFDVIIKSPGIPPQELLTTHYSLLTSATQIFLDSIRDTGALVIGVTGSKGKSTTASLIYEIFKAAEHTSCHPERRRRVDTMVHRRDGFDSAHHDTPALHPFLIGNIGNPALDYLEHANSKAVFVMEMSSYQLMDLTVSPEIAVIVSFFPEHLDYHGSLESYKEAKKHITKFQRTSDIVFFHAASDGARETAEESPGRHIPFSSADAPLSLIDTHLQGIHNLSNIACAWKVTEFLGIPKETAIAAIRSFQGLPHRLQSLGIHHGIEWVDDAISTTPESTIAALEALGGRVRTIILGGQDRGNDFSELGRVIASSSIKNVILFPGSGSRIKRAIESAGSHVQFFEVKTMEAAVEVAKRETPAHRSFSEGGRNEKPFDAAHLDADLSATRSGSATRLRRSSGSEREDPSGSRTTSSRPSGLSMPRQGRRATTKPIVLLSTASPSYNMFKNFEEKGQQFQFCSIHAKKIALCSDPNPNS